MGTPILDRSEPAEASGRVELAGPLPEVSSFVESDEEQEGCVCYADRGHVYFVEPYRGEEGVSRWLLTGQDSDVTYSVETR